MSKVFSALSLFPATPEQTTEARRRTLLEWGSGLTLEEHLARDAKQDQFDGCRDGRLITWQANHTPRDEPQTLAFKCACETLKRTGLVIDPENGTSSVAVICYGVASVFTPPENRGQGFARHMMRLLHWVIADESLLSPAEFPAAWGEPPPKVEGTRNGHFSALWSDVGEFYRTCGPIPGVRDGWVVRGTSTTILDVDSSPIPDTTLEWTWLDDSGVSQLWIEDAETIRGEVEKAHDAGVAISFLPTQGVASFQHRRLEIYLQRLTPPPEIWGVVSSDRNTYATWTIDPRPPAPCTLIVSRLRATTQNFAELVGRILEVAKKHNVKRVEVWNLSEELKASAGNLGAKTHERKEHLPAFKFYGKESEANISWAFNERCAW
ncbi:hypothetical protein B0H15DRAFT_768604 [Mycena belliarum]|uniref:LYC1 C-terminal domain-containing protein n=1 Tax=Mycena belliarum TaxID=1033014 RepID=A0AAD6UL59_9AGAR|nr:hypothetical protein B0H15DRAFT_768604 [Mycena belliae]